MNEVKKVVHKRTNDRHLCKDYDNYIYGNLFRCCSSLWEKVTCKKCLKLRNKKNG